MTPSNRASYRVGASGWQHHWLHVRRFPNGGEVAGDAQRGRSQPFSRCTHVQPGHGPLLLPLSAFVRGRAAVNRSCGDGRPCSQHHRNRRGFPDAFTIANQHFFIRLAQQHRLPAVYFLRTSVVQGALMSYGPDPYDIFRRSASYIDRILKGAKPADLPVQQPTKFELAINLKTAKALGLQIPDRLLALADEVIE
jgi:ABC transporter substrate binding protein